MSRFLTFSAMFFLVFMSFMACSPEVPSQGTALSLSKTTDPFGIKVSAEEVNKTVGRSSLSFTFGVSAQDAAKVAVVSSGVTPTLTGSELAILNSDTGLITPIAAGTITIEVTAADGASGSIPVVLAPIDLVKTNGTANPDGSGEVATLWEMSSYIVPSGNALGGGGTELPAGTYTLQGYNTAPSPATDPMNFFSMHYGLMIVGNVADQAVSGQANATLSTFGCNSKFNAGFMYNVDYTTFGPLGGGSITTIDYNYKGAWRVSDHVLTVYPIGGGSATYTVNGNDFIGESSNGVKVNLVAASSLSQDHVVW